MDDPELLAVAQQFAKRLMEHADSVQIFVTKYDDKTGETETVCTGLGNWLTRYGQVDEWLTCEKAIMKNKAIEQSHDD